MYQVLFRIGNPHSVAYESILKDNFANKHPFKHIGINPLSHTFFVLFDAPSFNHVQVLKLLANKGLDCSVEWAVENRSHIEHRIALKGLRNLTFRLLSCFVLSIMGYWMLPSEGIVFMAVLFGYVDTWWTHQLIIPCIALSSRNPISWIGATSGGAMLLYLSGKETYGHLLLSHLVLLTLSSALNVHTTLLYELAHAKENDVSWKTVKAVRKGIHDLINVPLDTLVGGEFIVVNIGDAFPTDGTITSGTTVVDDSWLDGKSTYLAKYEGDQVLAGSINITSSVLMISESSRRNSLFYKIHHHIIPQKKITYDSLSHWTPLLLALLGNYFVTNLFSLISHQAIYPLHQFLMDMLCSLPAMSAWAESIIYSFSRWHFDRKHAHEAHISNMWAFQHPIENVVFEKRLLTRGKKILRDIITLPSAITIELNFHSSFSKGAVLLIAASIQRHVNREIAKALLDAYIPNSTQKKPEEAIEIVASMLSFSCISPDQGIETAFHGSNILMGTPYWLAQKGKIDLSLIRDWIDICLLRGEHVEVMSLEGTIIAAFTFSEQYLDSVPNILENISVAGCRPFLLANNLDDPKHADLEQEHALEIIDKSSLRHLIASQKERVAILSFKPNEWKEEFPSAMRMHLYLDPNYHCKAPIRANPKREELVGNIFLFINEHLKTRKYAQYIGYFWSLSAIALGKCFSGTEHNTLAFVCQILGAGSIVLFASRRYKISPPAQPNTQ